jgi:hypothetical protein
MNAGGLTTGKVLFPLLLILPDFCLVGGLMKRLCLIEFERLQLFNCLLGGLLHYWREIFFIMIRKKLPA